MASRWDFLRSRIQNPDPEDSVSGFFILGYFEKSRNPGNRDRDLKIPNEKFRKSQGSEFLNLKKSGVQIPENPEITGIWDFFSLGIFIPGIRDFFVCRDFYPRVSKYFLISGF